MRFGSTASAIVPATASVGISNVFGFATGAADRIVGPSVTTGTLGLPRPHTPDRWLVLACMREDATTFLSMSYAGVSLGAPLAFVQASDTGMGVWIFQHTGSGGPCSFENNTGGRYALSIFDIQATGTLGLVDSDWTEGGTLTLSGGQASFGLGLGVSASLTPGPGVTTGTIGSVGTTRMLYAWKFSPDAELGISTGDTAAMAAVSAT